MEGLLDETQAARWEQIKKEFNKRKLMGGAGENDPVARVVAQMTQFNDGLEACKKVRPRVKESPACKMDNAPGSQS